MKVTAFLFPATVVIGLFQASSVHGTWSILATDRATGQVGGIGATCRDGDGTSLLDDDFGSGAGRGVLVGQALALESDVAQAEQDLQAGDTPSDIISKFERAQDQWAVLDYENAVVSTGQSVSDAADTTGTVKGDYVFSIQGNRLSSPNVASYARKDFRQGRKGMGKRGKGGKGKGGKKDCDDLADRLMRSMEAAVKDGDGDSDCTSKYPADTAYLLVKKPNDSDNAGNEYARLDVVSGSYNAIEELRELYDDWREDNPCEKRPKPHERFLPPLHRGRKLALGMAATVLAFLGIGVVAKRKGVVCSVCAPDFDEQTDDADDYIAVEKPYAFQTKLSQATGSAKDLSLMINRPPRTSFMQRVKAAMKNTPRNPSNSSDDAVFREEKVNDISIYVNPYVNA